MGTFRFSSKTRTKAPRGKLGRLLVLAPVALEVLAMIRQRQTAQRGKYTKARKRDKALDLLLRQAQKRLGGKRRW